MYTINVISRRKELQRQNIDNVKAILDGIHSEKEIRAALNSKALDRVMLEFDMTLPQLLGACQANHLFAGMVALHCAVVSSRQGAILESEIIKGISTVLSENNISMRKAKNVNEMRPMKSGGTMNAVQYSKVRNVRKKDALKSIDAFITEPFEAYVFAKVRTGVGGHQDNVDIEAHEFISWAKNEPNDKLYICLIDGEKDDTLYNSQTDNVWVCNHVEFQERVISYAEQCD